MKKFVILLLLAVAILTSLTACSEYEDYVTSDKEIVNSETASSMFTIVEETYNYKIVYCKTTKVMYAVSDSPKNHGNFTLLVNADGTPMIYKGE